MIDFAKLISPRFIFNPGLAAMSAGFAQFFYVLFGILLLLALIARLMARQQDKQKNLPLAKLWHKLTTFFFSLGLIGICLLFFRQQKVYTLSMPLFWYLWLIGAVVWLVFIIRWILVKMKGLQKEIEEKEEKEKYLP